MDGLSIFNEAEILALGWTLLHSVWQGLVLVLVLRLLLSFIPTRMPEIRYYSALTLLFIFVGATMYTYTLYSFPESSGSVGGLSLALSEFGTADSVGTFWTSFLDQLPTLFPYLVSGWLLGTLAFGVKTAGGLVLLRYQTRRDRIYLPENWRKRLDELKAQMGIRRHVQFYLTSKLDSPATIGLLKPVIYFPIQLFSGLHPDQVEVILLHELAHIKRYDFTINIIQSFIEALYFFNPAVWYISRVIREERECCCDRLAVEETGDSMSYARTLTELEWKRLKGHSLAMGMIGQKQSLLTRIHRIMGKKSIHTNNFKLSVLILLAISIGLISWKTIGTTEVEEPATIDIESPELTILSTLPLDIPAVMDTVPKRKMKKSKREQELELQVMELKKQIEELSKKLDQDALREEMRELERAKDILESHDIYEELNIQLDRIKELDQLEMIRDLEIKLKAVDDANLKIHIPEVDMNLNVDMDSIQKIMEMAQFEIQQSMKNIQLLREEEMKIAMDQVREQMEQIKLDELVLKEDMAKLREEMQVMKQKLEAFKDELAEELVKDGVLKNGEKLEGIKIKDGELQSVNGKRIKSSLSEKYRKLIEKHLGSDAGNFNMK